MNEWFFLLIFTGGIGQSIYFLVKDKKNYNVPGIIKDIAFIIFNCVGWIITITEFFGGK